MRDHRAALLACVHADPTAGRIDDILDDIDVDALIVLAAIHRVEGLVHDRLTNTDRDIPFATRLELNDLRMAAVERELLASRTVARLTDLLGVPFLVFKGPVLSSECYYGPGLRSFTDVDVCVRRRDFVTALESLTANGFTELASNWDGFFKHRVAEIPLANDRMVVDLHWHPIALGAHRRDIDLDEESLFAHARHVRLGPVDIATFDPEDTLLHRCVNSGLGGARRLLQLVDVDRVIRHHPIDWEEFVGRARLARAHALCCGVLQRARTLLDTPVDQSVVADLEPFRGWRGATGLADRSRHQGRLHQGIASGLLVSSGRATIGRTVAVVACATVNAILVRAGRPLPSGPGGHLDWHRTRGTARDADDRLRYLRWVSSGEAASAG